MRLPFVLSAHERDRGNFPELPCLNMVAEPAPSEDADFALVSRAGLGDRSEDMGAGPVEALFQRDQAAGGGLFGVSGGALYSGTTSLGVIAGTGPVSIVGWEDALFVNAGAGIYYWDTATLTTIAFPDGADVAKIAVGASRLVAIKKDTGRVYWSDPLTATIDALDFAEAESQPDRAKDLLFIDDNLIIFGAETVEIWPNTQGDPPFRPLENAVMERGIRETGCATGIGSTFAWVTNHNEVCIQSENNIVSTLGLQAKIEASTNIRLFNFFFEGREFLCLRLDNETQVMPRDTKTWHEFTSYGYSNWLPQCFAGGVFGSAAEGKTFAWNANHTDLSGQLERRWRAGAQINGGGFPVKNLSIRANPGQTPYLTGDYVEPVCEMRVSRDAGQTWGAWRQASLGAQGEYRKKVQWRALGQASQPGFLAEFRCTDPVPLRVSDVLINEPWGGR